jgi:hypothetical protein
MDRLVGGCLCADVRIVATGRPYRVASATASTVANTMALFHGSDIFPADAVTIEGETTDYAGRHFCSRCGSSVLGRTGDQVEVNLGALDAPDRLKPTYEQWTIRRKSWLLPSRANSRNAQQSLMTLTKTERIPVVQRKGKYRAET